MIFASESFAAGEPRPFPGGDTFTIMNALYPVQVEFYKKGQRVGNNKNAPVSWTWAPKAYGIGLDDPQSFDQVIITSEIAQDLTFDISDGVSGVNAITGVVDVVDASKEKTKEGLSHGGFAYLSAVVSNYNFQQVWNPADSGMNVFISEFEYTDWSAAGYCAVGRHNVALGSVYQSPLNKDFSAPNDADVEIRNHQQTSVILGTSDLMFFKSFEANKGVIHKFDDGPVMLSPGSGFVIQSGAVNHTTVFQCQYTRSPV